MIIALYYISPILLRFLLYSSYIWPIFLLYSPILKKILLLYSYIFDLKSEWEACIDFRNMKQVYECELNESNFDKIHG